MADGGPKSRKSYFHYQRGLSGGKPGCSHVSFPAAGSFECSFPKAAQLLLRKCQYTASTLPLDQYDLQHDRQRPFREWQSDE
jgi:hypothetical protein